MSFDQHQKDGLTIGGRTVSSRLFLGTGRFPSPAVMQQALEQCGADVITFAVRRVNLDWVQDDAILQHLEDRGLTYLPNTSGATNAAEAVRIANLARAAGLGSWIKVEISANPRTLLPDPIETLKATELLTLAGFTVLPYTSDDPVLCKRLEEVGAAAVMPGGSPIGTGLGILNPYNIGLIVEEANVPIIVDAGLGSAVDAAQAAELGADGILVNTPIAKAKDPVAMAKAMAMAFEAGRLSRAAGRIPRKRYASASSTPEGVSEAYWAGGDPGSGSVSQERSAAGRADTGLQAGRGADLPVKVKGG
ncbi:thiazole synthase [Paenibacillus tarimensis]|uniref:thiazole synthase n=1 Tax=Paenibacillus tarimensis TaxID=416012 RepID=UPI002E1D95EB